jgi:hypothetical protein
MPSESESSQRAGSGTEAARASVEETDVGLEGRASARASVRVHAEKSESAAAKAMPRVRRRGGRIFKTCTG